MKSNQNSTDDAEVKVDRNEKVISIENFNYLYPNGHRMTNQMRWFKGSRYREITSDMAS